MFNATPTPSCYTPPKEKGYPWCRRLGWPQGRSGQVWKILPPLEFSFSLSLSLSLSLPFSLFLLFPLSFLSCFLPFYLLLTTKHKHPCPQAGFFLYPLFVLYPYFYVLIVMHFCLLSLLYNLHNTNIHSPGGIRTRHPSKRSAADPRFRPLGP